MTFTQLVSNLHVYEQLYVRVTSSTYRIVEIIGEMNLMKGQLFWHTKMNAGRNMWAASAEPPKIQSPKQPFAHLPKLRSSNFTLYGSGLTQKLDGSSNQCISMITNSM